MKFVGILSVPKEIRCIQTILVLGNPKYGRDASEHYIH